MKTFSFLCALLLGGLLLFSVAGCEREPDEQPAAPQEQFQPAPADPEGEPGAQLQIPEEFRPHPIIPETITPKEQ